MKDLFLIGGFGIALFFGLASIPPLRMHFRTGMKGLLFMGVGGMLGSFGILGMTIRDIILAPLHEGDSLSDPIFLFFLVVLVVGGLIGQLGFIIVNTSESGLWVELGEKTTFRQRLTGNIPILKHEKPLPPAMSKRTGLIFGITAMTFGSLLIILNMLFKIQALFIHFFITAAFAIIVGLMLLIFSAIYLDKDKKPPE